MEDNKAKARRIIKKIRYITIATVDKNGQPWNAPVFTAYDKNLNFYWGTYKNSQKAKNIRTNKNIFLVIYDSTAKPGTGEGVYIKAVAEQLKDLEEIKSIHKLLWERHGSPFWKLELMLGNGPIRLYKAVPQKFWVNGGGEVNGNYIDIRIEVDLK